MEAVEAAEAALVSGVERPLEAEAPWLLKRGGSAGSAFPPIDCPLPENALKFAETELLPAAVDVPLSLSALASLAVPPIGPLMTAPPEMVPPMASPAVIKYGFSLNTLKGNLLSKRVALSAPIMILLSKP